MTDIKIICDDIENILNYIKPDSVDLILTDPPYPKKYLPLWTVLSEKASQILKPNGLLVTYTGHYWLPEVINSLNKHLKYVWTMALIHSGRKGSVFPTKMFPNWKPILVYKRPKGKITYGWGNDLISGDGREKDKHKWQQALNEAKTLINRFSNKGDFVVDPFLGSGTNALASKRCNRKFFGMDIDKTSYNTAIERIKENS